MAAASSGGAPVNRYTWIGLALALAGPGIVALLSTRFVGETATLAASAPWLAAFAGLLVAVAVTAFVGERLTRADVGFGRSSWRSVPLALLLAAFFILNAVSPRPYRSGM